MYPVNLSTRRPLRTFTLSFALLAITHLVFADELPSAPSPQLPTQIAAAITGIITDKDGAAISGARITLTPDNSPARAATTTADGRFTFPNLPPGGYKLSVAASGFASQQSSGVLHPGESADLHITALGASTTTNVEVTASPDEVAEAQVKLEEKQRVLGVIPNFYVSYLPNPVPLTPKQKSELAFKNAIDPVNFALVGVAAGIQQENHTYDWELGASGYAKRYAAGYGTFFIANLLGNDLLPILLKQDPRYFYKGTGSVRSRALYAMASTVMCKGDNQHWQPNYSAVLGGMAAGGLSNLYYPAANRSTATTTFEGTAIGISIGAVQNLIQEFLIRKLTPRVPPSPPLAEGSQ